MAIAAKIVCINIADMVTTTTQRFQMHLHSKILSGVKPLAEYIATNPLTPAEISELLSNTRAIQMKKQMALMLKSTTKRLSVSFRDYAVGSENKILNTIGGCLTPENIKVELEPDELSALYDMSIPGIGGKGKFAAITSSPYCVIPKNILVSLFISENLTALLRIGTEETMGIEPDYLQQALRKITNNSVDDVVFNPDDYGISVPTVTYIHGDDDIDDNDNGNIDDNDNGNIDDNDNGNIDDNDNGNIDDNDNDNGNIDNNDNETVNKNEVIEVIETVNKNEAIETVNKGLNKRRVSFLDELVKRQKLSSESSAAYSDEEDDIINKLDTIFH